MRITIPSTVDREQLARDVASAARNLTAGFTPGNEGPVLRKRADDLLALAVAVLDIKGGTRVRSTVTTMTGTLLGPTPNRFGWFDVREDHPQGYLKRGCNEWHVGNFETLDEA